MSTGLIGSGIASLFGLGPAAALDLAALGCGSSLGLATGIAAGPGGAIGQGGFYPGAGPYGGPGACDEYGGQVPVVARPILPYFKSTSRGFPRW